MQPIRLKFNNGSDPPFGPQDTQRKLAPASRGRMPCGMQAFVKPENGSTV
jgi:hypothetical protein